MQKFHLAQANAARMRAPLEDPIMSGFVERLLPLNEIADGTPGFIWRMQDEAGDATAIRVFDDPLILFNMSVWQSVDALEAYAYRSDHAEALRKRSDWFERPTRSPFVLWWIEAGQIPTVEEAKQRFDLLWDSGPGPRAFTFRQRFEPPEQ